MVTERVEILPIVSPVTSDKTREKFLVGPWTELSFTVMSTDFGSESPIAQVRVVSTAVKSAGDVAVPSVDVTFTPAAALESPVLVTVIAKDVAFSETVLLVREKLISPPSETVDVREITQYTITLFTSVNLRRECAANSPSSKAA